MQKSRLSLYQQFRRSFSHQMTQRTPMPKSASFAPRPFSTPPSLLVTTDHAIYAPFECEHYTRQKLARIAELSLTTLSSQTMPRRTTNCSHLQTSFRRTTAWVYTSRTPRSLRIHACCCNTIAQRLTAMSPAWAGQTYIVMLRRRTAR
jgi:hypothetical protein